MSGLDTAIRAKLELVETNRDLWFAVASFEDDVRGMLAALTAVLDLHKPVSNEAWASSTPAIVCSCSPGEDDHYDEPYPCPTVRAIAGKLGVEVERG